jgi:hypothetical protein
MWDRKKYLDLEGLKSLVKLIKAKFAPKKGVGAITVDDNGVALKIAETQGNVTLAQSEAGLTANVVIPEAQVTGVKTDDKVLSLTEKKLSATLGLSYDSENKKIKLTGINKAEIASIDTTGFIKATVNDIISTGDFTAKSLNTLGGEKDPVIKIEGGLLTAYSENNRISAGKKPNLVFGLNNDKDKKFQFEYYDDEGNLLWVLGPMGLI